MINASERLTKAGRINGLYDDDVETIAAQFDSIMLCCFAHLCYDSTDVPGNTIREE